MSSKFCPGCRVVLTGLMTSNGEVFLCPACYAYEEEKYASKSGCPECKDAFAEMTNLNITRLKNKYSPSGAEGILSDGAIDADEKEMDAAAYIIRTLAGCLEVMIAPATKSKHIAELREKYGIVKTKRVNPALREPEYDDLMTIVDPNWAIEGMNDIKELLDMLEDAERTSCIPRLKTVLKMRDEKIQELEKEIKSELQKGYWRCSQCLVASFPGAAGGVRDSTSRGLIRVTGKCSCCGSKKLEFKEREWNKNTVVKEELINDLKDKIGRLKTELEMKDKTIDGLCCTINLLRMKT